MTPSERSSLGQAVAELLPVLRAALDEELDVRIGPPRPAGEPAGVDLSYLSTTSSGATASVSEHRLPVELLLLASVHAEPERAIDVIDAIWAALDGTPVGIEPTRLRGSWWSACGVVPRPGVELVLAAVIERAAPEDQLVTVGVEVDGGARSATWLTGTVVGPGGAPLAAARVVPTRAPRLATRTDPRGRFAIAGMFPSSTVPAEVTLGPHGRPVELEIGADNRIELDHPPSPPVERNRP